MTLRWRMLLIGLLIGAANIWLWSLPLAQIAEEPQPELGAGAVVLDPGVVVRQTITLPTPAPRDVAIRIWTQRIVPTERPFLVIRGETDNRSLGVATIPLAPADGAFHVRQVPWWQLPPDARQLTLVIEGKGLRVALAAAQTPGGALTLNGAARSSEQIALQVVSGDLGIERYLPLRRIAENKPGLLAWSRYPLALLSLYICALIALLCSSARLLRVVEAASSPSSENTQRQL